MDRSLWHWRHWIWKDETSGVEDQWFDILRIDNGFEHFETISTHIRVNGCAREQNRAQRQNKVTVSGNSSEANSLGANSLRFENRLVPTDDLCGFDRSTPCGEWHSNDSSKNKNLYLPTEWTIFGNSLFRNGCFVCSTKSTSLYKMTAVRAFEPDGCNSLWLYFERIVAKDK